MSIFISYSRADRTQADALAKDLTSLGHVAWHDPSLVGGDPWWARILDQILRCNIFIFAASERSLKSDACKRERQYASALGKTTLVVLFGGISPEVLPDELRTWQAVDYDDPNAKSALVELTRALSKIAPPQVVQRPLPSPLPEPPDSPISDLSSLRDRIAAQAELSGQQQVAVLDELNVYMRSNVDPENARQLLELFRRRSGLIEEVANELDVLLNAKRRTRSSVSMLVELLVWGGLGLGAGALIVNATSGSTALLSALPFWAVGLYRGWGFSRENGGGLGLRKRRWRA